MIKPSRILLPIDGTKGSFRAALHAAYIANLTGAEVILLHCADPYPALALPLEATCAHRTTSERLGPARDILQDKDVRYMEHTVEGPAAETIVGMAQRERCDIIIMGRHGTGASDTELSVGRTAEHVVRTAPCTVIVAA